MIKVEISSTEKKTKTGADKEKLIMLVSDFYYGKHEGDIDNEEKTYTTFKCFSCSKVLKNNIRYVNIYVSVWKLGCYRCNYCIFIFLCPLR